MTTEDFSQSSGHYGVGFDLQAVVKSSGGVDITQAAVSSISAITYPAKKPNSTETTAIVVADTVYDTRQTGNGWNVGKYPDGFNWWWVVPGTLYPDPGVTYITEITFTLASGGLIRHTHKRSTYPRT